MGLLIENLGGRVVLAFTNDARFEHEHPEQRMLLWYSVQDWWLPAVHFDYPRC